MLAQRTLKTLLCTPLLMLTACGDDGRAMEETGITGGGFTMTTSGGGTSSGTGTTGTTGDTSTTTFTTTTTGTTDGTADTGTDDGDKCGEADWTFEPQPANVMFVLDKSGSMMEEWDDNGTTVTRWNTLFTVVQSTLISLETKVNFGVKLFPGRNSTGQIQGGACDAGGGVEVGVGPMNAVAILGAIPGANDTVAGGTPATEAVSETVDHLLGQGTANPPVMILVTDGAANCVGQSTQQYDSNFNTVVGNAFTNSGIPTYVVGIDVEPGVMDESSGVILYDQLNDVAVRGGVPKTDPFNPNEKFYNAADGAELAAAIEAIAGDLQSCSITLSTPPEYPHLVEIWVGGVQVPQVTDCATESGWMYTNPNGPYDQIELCGTACDQLKISGEADAKYKCPPVD